MILAVIIIAVAIVLGSKLLKGIFSTIGHAIKIIVKIAFFAIIAFVAISAFCKQNPEEAEAVATVAQSPKLARQFIKDVAPAFEKAAKAEYKAFSGEEFDESKETIKKTLKAGKANAKACEEELYGESDIVIE